MSFRPLFIICPSLTNTPELLTKFSKFSVSPSGKFMPLTCYYIYMLVAIERSVSVLDT